MTDIQRWRPHLARPRPPNGCLIGDHRTIRIDSPSPSTSPEAESVKPQPKAKRSLASFASYLNTHSRSFSPSNTPQWPSIDWSTLDESDHVHNPHNIELMCNSIIKQILINPSKELPAEYNSALLHVLESYTQLVIDRDVLQKHLESTAILLQTNLDKLDRARERWSEDMNEHELQLVDEQRSLKISQKRREQPKSSHEYLPLNTEQKIGEEAQGRGRRHSNGNEEPEYGPCPSPVPGKITLAPKTEAFEICHDEKMSVLLSPSLASAERGFFSLCNGLGLKRGRNLRSPSVKPGTIRVTNSSNSSRQKDWLTCLASYESTDTLAMNAPLLPEQSIAIELAAKEPSPGSGSSAHGTSFKRQARAPEVCQALIRPTHNVSYLRDFSFVPGADFETFSQARRKSYNPPARMIASSVDFGRTGSYEGSVAGHGAVGLLAFDTALGATQISSAGRMTSDGPCRDKSRKCNLTASKGTSNQISSLSSQDSLDRQAKNDSIQDPSKRTVGSQFAIAAARAAKQSTPAFRNTTRYTKY